MKQLDTLEKAGGSPAPAAPRRGEALRELVRFAMRQGYYDTWNTPQDQTVRSCASKGFPTDRKPFSG
jgi:hypothetical protein